MAPNGSSRTTQTQWWSQANGDAATAPMLSITSGVTRRPQRQRPQATTTAMAPTRRATTSQPTLVASGPPSGQRLSAPLSDRFHDPRKPETGQEAEEFTPRLEICPLGTR